MKYFTGSNPYYSIFFFLLLNLFLVVVKSVKCTTHINKLFLKYNLCASSVKRAIVKNHTFSEYANLHWY